MLLLYMFFRPMILSEHIRVKRNTTDNCPALQPSLDSLTQEEFISRLTESCRYDRLTIPSSDRPLRVNFQIDVKHIESVDNTVILFGYSIY